MLSNLPLNMKNTKLKVGEEDEEETLNNERERQKMKLLQSPQEEEALSRGRTEEECIQKKKRLEDIMAFIWYYNK